MIVTGMLQVSEREIKLNLQKLIVAISFQRGWRSDLFFVMYLKNEKAQQKEVGKKDLDAMPVARTLNGMKLMREKILEITQCLSVSGF